MKDGWNLVSLGKLVSMMRNGHSGKQNKNGVGYAISRIETIANGKIDSGKVGYIDASEDIVNKFSLKPGDILFSHINSKPHVGKTAIVEVETSLLHGMNLMLLRTNNQIIPYYLKYYLEHVRKLGYWIIESKQSVNQASVT